MRNKKLPEFTFLLEQFFTEYMPLSSGLSPNTVRSYKHSFRLLFQYIHQVKKKEAGEILFRDLDYETVDGFLRWIETERGCSVSTRNLRLSALASFAAYAQNRNFEATTVFANAVRRVPVKKKAIQPRTIFTLSEVSVLLRLPDPEKRLGFPCGAAHQRSDGRIVPEAPEAALSSSHLQQPLKPLYVPSLMSFLASMGENLTCGNSCSPLT